MDIRYNITEKKIDSASEHYSDEPDLDPPYDEQWPGWVLRTRRKRWTALPVVELCALLVCLAAIISLSRLDTLPATEQSPPLYAPAAGSD